jgi:hypothetical protein
MHIVAQGWLMYQLTNSALWLGLVGLMRALPLLGFPLLGGVLADRVRRTTILYVPLSKHAECLLPTRAPSQPRTPARKAGVLDLRKWVRPRDRLSPLEGDGFEPPVPPA